MSSSPKYPPGMDYPAPSAASLETISVEDLENPTKGPPIFSEPPPQQKSPSSLKVSDEAPSSRPQKSESRSERDAAAAGAAAATTPDNTNSGGLTLTRSRSRSRSKSPIKGRAASYRSDSSSSLLSRPPSASSASSASSGASSATADSTSDRRYLAKPKKMRSGVGDFAAWGRKNTKRIVPMLPTTDEDGTTNPAPAAPGGDSDDDGSSDSGSDKEDKAEAKAERLAEMFTVQPPTPRDAGADNMISMMRNLIPTREIDGLARHLIFSRRDRLDKLKEYALNTTIALVALLTYCLINALITRWILSGLYGIDASLTNEGTLSFHGGVVSMSDRGSLMVNVAEKDGV